MTDLKPGDEVRYLIGALLCKAPVHSVTDRWVTILISFPDGSSHTRTILREESFLLPQDGRRLVSHLLDMQSDLRSALRQAEEAVEEMESRNAEVAEAAELAVA